MVNALAELPAQAAEKEILLAIVTDQRRKGDDFERLRTRAGVALARLSDPETVAPLLTLISSRKEESHADEIVQNLGGFQDPRITALLTKALEKGSESESRALAAVEALYRQATSSDARREEVKRQFQAAWKKEEKRGKKTDTVDLRLALAGRLAQLGDDSKEGFVRSELQFPSGGLGFTVSVDPKGGDSGKGELMADQLRQMLGGIIQTSRRDKAIESLALFRDPQVVSAVERILNETKDEVDGVELTRTLELAEKVASLDRDRIIKAVLSLLGRSTIDLDNKLSLRRTLNRIQAAAAEPQNTAGKP